MRGRSTPRSPSPSPSVRLHRLVLRPLLATAALAGVAVGVVPAVAAGASAPSGRLEVFQHPLRVGHWTAHGLRGVPAGTGAPAVAAGSDGQLLIATRSKGGAVTFAQGEASGAFASVNLATAAAAPPAAGRLAVAVDPDGAVSVWFRTTSGGLEVVSRSALGQPWSPVDVTALTGGPLLAGDPTVVTPRSGPTVAYAVAVGGTVVEVAQPVAAGQPWTERDPTGGLTYPALAGTVGVLSAPGAPAATVLMATTSWGDVLELSNQLASARQAVGPWHLSDMTALGAPGAAGPLGSQGAPGALESYVSWGGDLVSVTLTSGLPGGFTVVNLTRTKDAVAAQGAVPLVVRGPLGSAVAVRTATGDLHLVGTAPRGSDSDVSFENGTAELVGSDVSATTAAGVVDVVAVDGGPIAPTPLLRRILVTSSSFDQQHRALQTTPGGSDCNPFTAALGRGSSWGCKPGTSAEAWCSDFAQWVWQTSGVPTRGITGWSASFVQWGAAHHRVQFGTHFHARVGDAIVWGTRSPLYGTHVGIVVAVVGDQIDVESGNSGGDLPGFDEGVWRSGLFVGSTSTVSGYHVLGVVTP